MKLGRRKFPGRTYRTCVHFLPVMCLCVCVFMREKSDKLTSAAWWNISTIFWLIQIQCRCFARWSVYFLCTIDTVTGSKLSRSLNDDCDLPGWARDLWVFSMYSYVSEDTRFHSPTWNSLVLAANLSKPSHFDWEVVFSKWDGWSLTLHNFTIR